MNKYSDYQKKWREKHPNYIKNWRERSGYDAVAYMYDWRKRHKEHIKEYNRNYKLRKQSEIL